MAGRSALAAVRYAADRICEWAIAFQIDPITYQPASLDMLAIPIDGREFLRRRSFRYLRARADKSPPKAFSWVIAATSLPH